MLQRERLSRWRLSGIEIGTLGFDGGSGSGEASTRSSRRWFMGWGPAEIDGNWVAGLESRRGTVLESTALQVVRLVGCEAGDVV
jgi:hypothetical protein